MQVNCQMRGKWKRMRYLALILVCKGSSKDAQCCLYPIYGLHVVLLSLNLWFLTMSVRRTWGRQA